MEQTRISGRNASQQTSIFAPVDGALFDRLNQLISKRGLPSPNDGTDHSGETASLAVPTLQDLLQRRS